MSLAVTPDQFEIRGDRIIHKPTGAEFVVQADNVVAFGWGLAGQPLGDGERFDPDTIKQVAVEVARDETGSAH